MQIPSRLKQGPTTNVAVLLDSSCTDSGTNIKQSSPTCFTCESCLDAWPPHYQTRAVHPHTSKEHSVGQSCPHPKRGRVTTILVGLHQGRNLRRKGRHLVSYLSLQMSCRRSKHSRHHHRGHHSITIITITIVITV